FAQRSPEPWEFRAKSVWAKAFVLCAGVTMNVLLAIGIFWGINYTHGKLMEETTEIGYVVAGSAAQKAGMESGDNIVAVNDKPVSYWEEILNAIYIENFGKDLTITVDRTGATRQIALPRTPLPANAPQALGITEART